MPRRRMVCLLFTALACSAIGQPPQSQPASSTQPATVDSLVPQLGDEDFRTREEATRQLIALGDAATTDLTELLATQTDPEVRRRITFVLENIAPPRQGILVVRVDPASGLAPGDLITHIDGTRARYADAIERRVNDGQKLAALRVRGEAGARDVPNVDLSQIITASNYISPRGELIRAAVRLYAAGRVEEAFGQLQKLPENVPPSELSPELRAIIAHTAGAGELAEKLLTGRGKSLRLKHERLMWTGPSGLDELGPGRAPFHLELFLWAQPGSKESTDDEDMPTQRVLVPAARRMDALLQAAQLWRKSFASNPDPEAEVRRKAGNMLAISSWMMHDMGLESECTRLIEPRSKLLRATRGNFGFQRWVRMQTDSWLHFLAGQPEKALENFYNDAERILNHPDPNQSLIQNPQVAAIVAFFAYQLPADKRSEDLLRDVNRSGHAGLTAYAYWMLYSLNDANNPLIRRHLAAMLPTFDDADRPLQARRAALLEYAQSVPDPAVFASAREWLISGTDPELRERGVALVDTLAAIATHHPDEAQKSAKLLGDDPGARVLRHTAEFLGEARLGIAPDSPLAAPLLAEPLGQDSTSWLVLGRDRRLYRYDGEKHTITGIQRPTPAWFPGPLNWPWLGREESSGRAWVYGQRRVIEVQADGKPGTQINVQTDQISVFDRVISPVFSTLADAAAAWKPDGECGEFLQSELQSGVEYTADPNLPDLGVLRPVAGDARFAHVCLRGGEQFLIGPAGKIWRSKWIAEQLGAGTLPSFFPQGVPPAGRDDPANLYLFSNQGVIHLNGAAERVTRVALPGAQPAPSVIPEWAPYVRTDARFVYGARLPEDGGFAFRIRVADDSVELLPMVNEALPPDFYAVQSRADLREKLSQRLEAEVGETLEEYVSHAIQIVDTWTAGGTK